MLCRYDKYKIEMLTMNAKVIQRPNNGQSSIKKEKCIECYNEMFDNMETINHRSGF